ncbi:hypothetical protein [Roseococcus pinisoli]|uniref:Uncharacterized protein n=1 Tax=Roseococcus pinisoli TaxID=2835040 RepID=A0ABS5QGB4_9PROT|nr:hypothetical protein [Roseococcus pinisoli]MBS7812366.1 hypothetical protein [Roseococcus pinisoli]
MPVMYPINGALFLEAIGFPSMKTLHNAGVSFEQTAHKFTVKFPDKDRISLACGPAFSKAAIEQTLTEHTILLHAAALKQFVADLTDKLSTLFPISHLPGDATSPPMTNALPEEVSAAHPVFAEEDLMGIITAAAPVKTSSDTPALDMLAGPKPKKSKKPPALEELGISVMELTDLEMKTMTTVPLRQATRMYQPVSGTDGHSRYHVVALSPAVNVAARYHNGALSIRVEGPGLGELTSGLSANGFTPKSGGGKPYASIHMAVSDENLMHKSLGALLLGLGVPFKSPMPHAKRLVGVGS